MTPSVAQLVATTPVVQVLSVSVPPLMETVLQLKFGALLQENDSLLGPQEAAANSESTARTRMMVVKGVSPTE